MFSLLCHWLVSCCCLCDLCFPCCVIGWSRAAVYVLCKFLLCYRLVLYGCLCAEYFSYCVIGWSRAAVYVLYILLAVSLVGLVLLSMCFVFSLLCHWLVSCCCLCALCFPCCVIGWSRAAVYVLCVFLAVSLVGLVLLSMCFVFSLLCHWLVSCCCLCALCFPCCVIGWSPAAVYVLCFPCCVIGWSRAAVYVLCVFLAVSWVGLELLSMFFVFSLLCHWLVSCCCLCACVFLAVSLVGLVLLSMCFVFSLLCH